MFLNVSRKKDMEIYCPQIDAKTECDCEDKCDGYKVDLKTKIGRLIVSMSKKQNSDEITTILNDLEYEISMVIDG